MRRILVSAFVLALAIPLGSGALPAAAAAPDVAESPSMHLQGVLIDPTTDQLIHNPTQELIFPSVIRAADHFASPIAEYYMYVAPHDSPGGISLYTSDDLDGPWIEYAGNPVISNRWSPHYSVSHVSSPSAVWNAEEDTMFLYFHGENSVTRFATSEDGISFTYGGTAITTAMLGSSFTEASYGKVSRYTIPRLGNRWMMTFMSNTTANVRRMHLAYSMDGRSWTVQSAPLVSPNASTGTNVGSGEHLIVAGRHYVVYNATSGNLHYTEVGADFDQSTYRGVFADPASAAPERDKIGGFAFFEEGGKLYAFADIGGRLDGRIALYHDVRGETPVPNGGFEYDPLSTAVPTRWAESGAASASFLSRTVAAPEGRTYLAHRADAPYTVATSQNVTVPNGTYTVSVRVRASTAAGVAAVKVRGYDTSGATRSAAAIEDGVWRAVTIANVAVTDGSVEIVLASDGRAAGAWANFDQVRITRQ